MEYLVNGKRMTTGEYTLTLALMSQKGGVMKTTLTLLTGQKLASLGFRVLMVDTDAQRNLTLFTGVAERADNIFTVLAGYTKDVRQAITSISDKLDILIGTTEMKKWNSLSDTLKAGEIRLEKALKSVKNDYDFILIDTPPALDNSTINAMVAADGIIIPTEAKKASILGILDLKDDFEEVKDLYDKSNLRIVGIVATRVEKGGFGSAKKIVAREHIRELKDIADEFGTVPFKKFISNNSEYEEVGEFSLDYFNENKKNVVTTEISNFVNNILELERIEVL